MRLKSIHIYLKITSYLVVMTLKMHLFYLFMCVRTHLPQ